MAAPLCAVAGGALNGKHTGHAWIRGTPRRLPEGDVPLRADEVTIAEVLATRLSHGAVGKWASPAGTPGDADKQGFEHASGFSIATRTGRSPIHLYSNGEGWRSYRQDYAAICLRRRRPTHRAERFPAVPST